MQSSKDPLKRIPARLALCILSLASISITFAAGAAERTATVNGTAIWAVGLCGLWLLYGAWLKLERPFSQTRYWVLAAALSGVMTLGQSFAAVGTSELLTAHKLKAALFFAGRIPLYFSIMRIVADALEKRGKPGPRSVRLSMFGMILLLCWLPYWYMTFPGTVSNDSITQLKEIFGVVPMANGNPVLQTGLIGLCVGIGDWLGGPDIAVALYCGVQAVLMAWLLGALLDEMARSAAPRWLVWGSLAFYALCPVFPVFAFCMGKDTNFAMAVLFLSLEVWRALRLPEGARTGVWGAVRLCVAAMLCALLRNPGVYLALLTLALLLIWRLMRVRRAGGKGARGLWAAPACAIAAVLCAYGAVHLLVIPGLAIAPMPETENYSIPLQQVARVAAGGALTAEESAAIDGVLELDKLKGAYNGELSDPVKLLWREDATEAEKQAFWKTWLGLLRKHPATCFSATFHNTYGYLYPGFMSTIKPTLLIGNQATRTANVAGVFDYTVNPRSEKLKALTDRLAEHPLYRLLVSPGLYGWITLFGAVCLLKKGKRRNLLAAVPALFTLAGCMLSAVNAYFRYAMPLYLSAPFLLWLCARAGEERGGAAQPAAKA